MKRYELTISPTYVSDWGLREGVREFEQNAIDQQTTDSANRFTWKYDDEQQKLYLRSETSVLEPATLLLGVTTKANDDSTIGQFGEGYKVGTLACIRSGHKVTIYNYGKREIWQPKMIKSRRYGNTEILVFDVEKKPVWDKVPDADLTIEIDNITVDNWKQLEHDCLQFQLIKPHHISTPNGSVLLNPKYQGEIYVNGLFVCEQKQLQYGYDIPAKYLLLDRDRTLIKEFDVRWATSQIWKESCDNDRMLDLISSDWKDAEYLTSYGSAKLICLSDKAFQQFLQQHGKQAAPVTTESEARLAASVGLAPIIVSESYRNMINQSVGYKELREKTPIQTPKQQLRDWFDQCIAPMINGEQTLEQINATGEQWIQQFEQIFSLL